MATEKSISWRDELAAEIKIRLSALAQTKAFSSDGSPNLLIGTGSTDSDSAFVKISAVATIAKDVLGLAQNVYTPHVCQVVFETSSTGATDATRYTLWATLALKGIRVELYEVAHGTGPSEAAILSTNLKTAFEPHAQYPGMASM